MAAPASTPIFVGVPVYRGQEFVEETLRSIRDQEFDQFHVVISVDGGDDRSADICAKYTADPRFELVIQEQRLGWARNLNWLMSRCVGEFFCYWQQDDLCATSYFRRLYDHGIQHPEASCVYADMQWFGSRIHRDELTSVIGPPLRRILELLERPSAVPFRGLVRANALQAAGPLRINAYDSRLEDFVWVAKLAREGELHRVAETLYLKRCHNANTHSFSASVSKDVRRGAWLEYGLGVLEGALPVVPESDRVLLLNTVLERLILPRPGRLSIYDFPDADELIGFAADFVDATCRRLESHSWESIVKFPDPDAILQLLGLRYVAGGDASERLVCEIGIRESNRRHLLQEAALRGRIDVRFGRGQAGVALLENGWSIPEEWGVWSNGRTARLRLPVPEGRAWRLVFHATCFVDGLAPGESRQITVRAGETTLIRWVCTIDDPSASAELALPASETPGGLLLDFDFPNAISPAELGRNDDARHLGLALERLVLERRD